MEALFLYHCPKTDLKFLDEIMELSIKIGDMPGILYRHDPYQATIAAIEIALGQRHTLLILPTNCGKTFVGGIIGYYNMHTLKKSVMFVSPNDDFKA